MTDSPARRPTAIDTVADTFVARYAALDPNLATELGIAGHEEKMTDLSPAGHATRADLVRETLAQVGATPPADATDETTVAAMTHTLGSALALYEAGEDERALNNIASPVQGLRDVFDLMATATVQDWAVIAARLHALPAAMDGYVESLRAGAARSHVAAARQVAEGVRQADELADPSSSFFVSLVAGAPAQTNDALRHDLVRAAQGAAEAYGRLAAALRELAPLAPERDGVGRERYTLLSRSFLGASVDLDETYAWGLDELERLSAEQTTLAHRIAGRGAGLAEAVAALDGDPAHTLHGTVELQEWMQRTSDAAITALDGVHFDIPGPLHRLECRIAPTTTGGIYYTGPSDDLTRPGRMWWSVPPAVSTFTTWRETTTVYHEGVPGHHLQIGTALLNRADLNDWRRLMAWTSGHGEGWALYAERLMADLGFLDEVGQRFGMLDGQVMRAARVVFDLGVHLGLPAPQRWGGGTWDAQSGWRLLAANLHQDESSVRFEWLRYLGWPGQAPSYKVGQRLWERMRDEARAAATGRGEVFDLRAFHARALRLGALPLEVLQRALSPDAGAR